MANAADQLSAIFQQMQVQGPAESNTQFFRGDLTENFLEWLREMEPGRRRLPMDLLKVERFQNHLRGSSLDFYLDVPANSKASWTLVLDIFSQRFVTDYLHTAYAVWLHKFYINKMNMSCHRDPRVPSMLYPWKSEVPLMCCFRSCLHIYFYFFSCQRKTSKTYMMDSCLRCETTTTTQWSFRMDLDMVNLGGCRWLGDVAMI